MTDIRKSINSIINERLSSPFYGTFILSWLVCNWKIVYLTFFVSQDKIEGNKIDFILSKYSEINHLVCFPIISTIILLTLMPFVSNGAYWLSLKFNIWRSDKKNVIEREQLLTIKQSIELRELLADKEKTFNDIVSKQDLEIKTLKSQLDSYKDKNNIQVIEQKPQKAPDIPTETQTEDTIRNLYYTIENKEELYEAFNIIKVYIDDKKQGIIGHEKITKDILDFFVLNNIIIQHLDYLTNKEKGVFYFSNIGKEIDKKFINSKFKITVPPTTQILHNPAEFSY